LVAASKQPIDDIKTNGKDLVTFEATIKYVAKIVLFKDCFTQAESILEKVKELSKYVKW